MLDVCTLENSSSHVVSVQKLPLLHHHHCEERVVVDGHKAACEMMQSHERRHRWLLKGVVQQTLWIRQSQVSCLTCRLHIKMIRSPPGGRLQCTSHITGTTPEPAVIHLYIQSDPAAAPTHQEHSSNC